MEQGESPSPLPIITPIEGDFANVEKTLIKYNKKMLILGIVIFLVILGVIITFFIFMIPDKNCKTSNKILTFSVFGGFSIIFEFLFLYHFWTGIPDDYKDTVEFVNNFIQTYNNCNNN